MAASHPLEPCEGHVLRNLGGAGAPGPLAPHAGSSGTCKPRKSGAAARGGPGDCAAAKDGGSPVGGAPVRRHGWDAVAGLPPLRGPPHGQPSGNAQCCELGSLAPQLIQAPVEGGCPLRCVSVAQPRQQVCRYRAVLAVCVWS